MTIAKEVDIAHPAVLVLVEASKHQQSEYGDATNILLTFAGELLNQAETLIKNGLHPQYIVSGYKKQMKAVPELLDK